MISPHKMALIGGIGYLIILRKGNSSSVKIFLPMRRIKAIYGIILAA
jgi:hypothetical protein